MSDLYKQKKCLFLSGNKCELGHFGGTVSPNLCKVCIKKQINHKKFANLYARKPQSLKTKAKQFLKEIKMWALSGFKLTPRQLTRKRLKVCKSCEFYKNHSCTRCGCTMAFKARLKTSSCPIKKW